MRLASSARSSSREPPWAEVEVGAEEEGDELEEAVVAAPVLTVEPVELWAMANQPLPREPGAISMEEEVVVVVLLED